MILIILLSLLSWSYLLSHSHKHPILGVPREIRGGGGGEVSSHTYYYYRIKMPHTSLDPSKSIIFYDAYGVEIYTLAPYSEYMDYGMGIVNVPGSEKNLTVESIATATYYVFYSTDNIIIDYEKAEFKIAKKLIKVPAQAVVKATYQYYSVVTIFTDVASVIDGRYDTQVQTIFYGEPPTGYNYAIIDLGAVKTIQALDILTGFFKPDENRKFNVNFKATIQYSLNGTDYYDISDKTNTFSLSGGESKSFEEEDLGVGFTARYLKLLLENVDKIEYSSTKVTVSDTNRQQLIDYGTIDSDTDNGTIVTIQSGVWVVALTEISAFDNIVMKSEAKLIPRTLLSQAISIESGDVSGSYPTTVNVDSTTGFDDVESGYTYKTAYILNDDGTYDAFTYTGLTATSFTGVTGLAESHSVDDAVVQEIAGDTTIYDYNTLRPKLGDRLYKANKVDDNTLYSQSQLDYVAKEYLKEFVKNHTKIQVEVLYSPHLNVGDTIRVIDSFSGIDRNYFIESIKDSNGFYTLVLSYYPSS